ncbi:hypothetical protein NHL50_14525 [Acidimicrobiia bacterium EGI L10123]|uniref:hypothetical protein n=1 Tax=Salinilacustrithrix flava TaxID=2957203 RepID=UPI003D7C1994|nr:hypothetical protein [Acidimicrobiia bacterium EGI L10123]
MDIPLLPGDSSAIRSAAADLTGTVPRLRTAHGAAVQVEAVLTGDHWQGTAFDAFRRVVERKPLPQALDAAVDRMGQAAEKLHWFAGRFDEHQDRLRHLRAQAASLDPADAALAAQRPALEAQVEMVLDAHRACLDSVAELFDWLDDQPTFATPPPSNWDRVTGTVGDAIGGTLDVLASFGTGVYEGFRDLVLGIRDLLLLLDPTGWPDLWSNRGQILAMLQYVAENPIEFLGDLGTALLDLDTLFEDPARWLGRRVPDLLLALGTVGTGTVASRAAGAARAMRGPLGQLDDAARTMTVAQRLRRTDGIAGQYARLGADDARLTQRGAGAFTRTDTVIGRLAARTDGLGAVVQAARQGPGTVLGEIRALTDLPVDAALSRLPIADGLREQIRPWAGRSFGNLVTGGFTAQLARVDGLLVGAPALSGRAYAATVGAGGVEWLNDRAGTLGTVQATVEAATPPACR